MIKSDDKSNAQCWELEVTCKNRKYLKDIVGALLKHGMINFEVELIDYHYFNEDGMDARYTVFMWCTCFNHLLGISTDLQRIEDKHEK